MPLGHKESQFLKQFSFAFRVASILECAYYAVDRQVLLRLHVHLRLELVEFYESSQLVVKYFYQISQIFW